MMGLKTVDYCAPKTAYIPGPGTYDSKADYTIKKDPAFSMGSGLRPDLAGKQNNVPGPGNYAGNFSATLKENPKFGFGTSKRDDSPSRNVAPGPGTYDSKTVVGMEGPKSSMGVRPVDTSMKESRNKPGPGTYDNNWEASKNKSPSTKIGTG